MLATTCWRLGIISDRCEVQRAERSWATTQRLGGLCHGILPFGHLVTLLSRKCVWLVFFLRPREATKQQEAICFSNFATWIQNWDVTKNSNQTSRQPFISLVFKTCKLWRFGERLQGLRLGTGSPTLSEVKMKISDVQPMGDDPEDMTKDHQALEAGISQQLRI